jgi:hypothetical protein
LRFFQENGGNHAAIGICTGPTTGRRQNLGAVAVPHSGAALSALEGTERIVSWPSGSSDFMQYAFFMYNQQISDWHPLNIWLILDLNRKTPLLIPQDLLK